MPIDDRTTNRSYKLPNAGNFLADDVQRLRDALTAIDADVFARYTKAETDQKLADLINGAPGALDTLNELAAAMGNDPNFAATITNALAGKPGFADVWTRAQADARYVQGINQTENNFTGTGSQTTFTLTQTPPSRESLLVTVDGVVQPTTEYNLSGSALILSEAPASGARIRVLMLGFAVPVQSASTLSFTQQGIGAVTRTVDSKLKDVVSVKDFGAVGDGVADDTAAFTAALVAARRILVPWGNYRLTSTITLNQVGHALVSTGRTAQLIGDHTSGPVITITTRQCCLQDLIITSSNTRQAYTTGATYDLAAGLHGVRVYNTAASTTQCLFEGVIVQRQPSHGWYSGATGTGTVYRQCQANGNRGHGFLFDDRTELGGTSSRAGICDLLSCLAVDNGGNAVNLSQTGSTCYRFRVINLETFNNAWNTSIPSLENSEVYVKGENHLLETCAVSDQLGGTRTTVASTGDARLAKAALGRGVFVGSSSNNIFLINNRFISVDRGVVTGTSLGYLFANGAYFTQRNLSGTLSDVPVGFQIGSRCLKPVVQVSADSAVTTMVTSDSLATPPLVAKKLLSSSYNVTATAAYYTITGMEETVFLSAGTYRFTCAATVQNGSTDGANYSLGVLLTDSLSATSRPAHAVYKTFTANYYDTLSLDFIHTISASDTYTISLQLRQGNGNLGTVLGANSTFSNTAFFVERLL